MKELKSLSFEEMKEVNGGSILPDDFKGSWWCVFCWVDYAYQ